MSRTTVTACLTLCLAGVAFAQTAKPRVDFEMMTWPEIKQAIRDGRNTVLVMNGGTFAAGTPQRERRAHAHGTSHY